MSTIPPTKKDLNRITSFVGASQKAQREIRWILLDDPCENHTRCYDKFVICLSALEERQRVTQRRWNAHVALQKRIRQDRLDAAREFASDREKGGQGLGRSEGGGEGNADPYQGRRLVGSQPSHV